MSEGLRLDTLRKIRDRLAGDRVGLVKFFGDRDVYSTLIEHLDGLITEEEAASFGGRTFTCEGCGEDFMELYCVQATRAAPALCEDCAQDEGIVREHLDDEYSCPDCGRQCEDHQYIIHSSPIRFVGAEATREWTDTVKCRCGCQWEVESGE